MKEKRNPREKEDEVFNIKIIKLLPKVNFLSFL